MSTFKQFNYFICIVEEGSFIAASEKLFIAQSALSRQIKNLEEELAFEVFDRSEKRIKLTAAGQALYRSLKNHLNNLDSAIAFAQGISRGDGRTLKIAHSSSIILDQEKLSILEQLCDTYNIDIEINILPSELQVDALLSGDIDLGLIRPPIYHSLNDVHATGLYTAPLYVAANIADPSLSHLDSVHLHDLQTLKFVSVPHAERGGLSYLASNLCLSHGFVPKKSRIRSRKLSQLDLVAQGFGICIVPEEFRAILPDLVRLIPINDHNSRSEVKLLWRKDEDALIRDCADLIQSFYRGN